MNTYRTLSASEARDFLRSRGKPKAQPHAMTKRVCHWVYCSRCGTVALKNEASIRALRAPCEVEE